ncbi:hypothetical protein HJFPF1_01676 [Paramyrothecium foliicola]|nr:hypothetical protein HJFPF1_01676 [Paramyrothecium foliicola]
MALAQQEKRFDSDSSDAESISVSGPSSRNAPKPWFPPPPTAPIREMKARICDVPQPVREMPPLPKPEAIPIRVQSPLSRLKARPRTLLQRIEGWWDLGLIEKRQTLFGGGNGSPVSQNP